MNISENELTAFLPLFLDEEIYLADKQLIAETKTEVVSKTNEVVSQPIVVEKKELVAVETPKIEVIKRVSTPSVVVEMPNIELKIDTKAVTKPEEEEVTRVKKNTIILVSYPQGIPSEITQNINKIFGALNIQKSDMEVLNVTVAIPELLTPFIFDYLILFGGKGKALKFLENYNGNRDLLEVGKMGNTKVVFAEKLDIYLQTGNEEKKKTFWNTLKTAYGK